MSSTYKISEIKPAIIEKEKEYDPKTSTVQIEKLTTEEYESILKFVYPASIESDYDLELALKAREERRITLGKMAKGLGKGIKDTTTGALYLGQNAVTDTATQTWDKLGAPEYQAVTAAFESDTYLICEDCGYKVLLPEEVSKPDPVVEEFTEMGYGDDPLGSDPAALKGFEGISLTSLSGVGKVKKTKPRKKKGPESIFEVDGTMKYMESSEGRKLGLPEICPVCGAHFKKEGFFSKRKTLDRMSKFGNLAKRYSDKFGAAMCDPSALADIGISELQNALKDNQYLSLLKAALNAKPGFGSSSEPMVSGLLSCGGMFGMARKMIPGQIDLVSTNGQIGAMRGIVNGIGSSTVPGYHQNMIATVVNMPKTIENVDVMKDMLDKDSGLRQAFTHGSAVTGFSGGSFTSMADATSMTKHTKPDPYTGHPTSKVADAIWDPNEYKMATSVAQAVQEPPPTTLEETVRHAPKLTIQGLPPRSENQPRFGL